MAKARIAVLFDAENINCTTALAVLKRLGELGEVPIRRAVGDFSSATLAAWIGCARDHGIELILQPGLGKGKNGADIRLSIEAMYIMHQGSVNTVALVTHDRDFAPLALRLRHGGLTVLGFALTEPNIAFRAACERFEVIGKAEVKPVAVVPVAKPKAAPVATGSIVLEAAAVARLRQIAVQASKQGHIHPLTLQQAIVAAAPELATRLSGQSIFFKTLVEHGIVERVGSGPELLVQAPRLHQAG